MNWTNDDVTIVEKFIEIKNKGYYADGTQVTEVYNRILNKKVAPTNCGSCIRARINEMEQELNKFKRQLELNKKEEETNNKTPKKTKKKEG